MKRDEKKPQICIYLAGPIDEVSIVEAAEWRMSLDLPVGVLSFNPVNAYGGASHGTAARVEGLNRMLVQQSNGVLVNLLDREKAFGTIREVEFARLTDKPVVVVADPPLLGLSAFDVFQEQDLQAGLDRLVTVIDEQMNQPPAHPALLIQFGPQPPEVDGE